MDETPTEETVSLEPAGDGDGGANFVTHRLQTIDADRLELRPTLGVRLFAGLFIALGSGGFLFAGSMALRNETYSFGQLLTLIPGLLFGSVGVKLWRNAAAPITLDREMGVAWRGRGDPPPMDSVSRVEIDDVVAVQVLPKTGDEGQPSIEMNLVLRDGDRFPLVDHPRLPAIRLEAEEIGRLLCVPVWEAPD